MGVDFDWEDFDFALGRASDATLVCLSGHGADTFDRTNQINERSQIVGCHIKDRATAQKIVESRVRMPGFGASAEHKGCPASDGADLTRVYDFSAGLDTGAK